MNKELKDMVNGLVNDNLPCENCKMNYLCEYFDGDENVECAATDFVNGVQATLKHLASIPWDKAIHLIADSVKEEES